MRHIKIYTGNWRSIRSNQEHEIYTFNLNHWLGAVWLWEKTAKRMSPWKAAKLQTLIRLTKLDCQTITASIKQYYNDYQRYPTRKEQKANTDGSDLTYNSEAASNSDAIVILMANSQLSDVNQGHRRNPKKFRYFDPKMVEGKNSHGVGSDGVFRDPWGNPYIITVDFNGDGKCCDFFLW